MTITHLVTHSGGFHADELLSSVILTRLFTSADVSVNAPAGIVVDELKFDDTKFVTNATRTEFKDAYVPGTLVLTSPNQTIMVDNRTPLPQYDSNVQIHEPSFSFALTLDGFATSTTGIVVNYDETSKPTSSRPSSLDGVSLTRDTVRHMLQADDPMIGAFGSVVLTDPDDEEELDVSDLDGEKLEVDGVEYMVFVRGSGPAVMLRTQ